MQMDEWDRTDMGFPRALAESAAYQYASARAFAAESTQSSHVAVSSADDLKLTWLEVFDESSDAI